jgi:hypothetical protein
VISRGIEIAADQVWAHLAGSDLNTSIKDLQRVISGDVQVGA